MTIPGGYILLARKITESGIMDKPPLYFKLWVWMLEQANHKDGYKGLKRGQFFTTIEEMREAMSWHVGYRKVRPSRKEIRNPYEWFTKGHMIDTAKVTHGMIITILNYNEYQNPKNYEGHNEGPHEKVTKGQTGAQYKQEGEECKNDNNPPKSPQGDKVVYPEWLDQKLWKEFKAHRRRLGKAMTPHAEKLTINKLEKFRKQGHQPDDLINLAIEKGWQGIYPPKNNGQGGSVLSFKQRHNAQVLHDFVENGGDNE